MVLGRQGDMFVITLSRTSLKKLGLGAMCCALVVCSALLALPGEWMFTPAR